MDENSNGFDDVEPVEVVGDEENLESRLEYDLPDELPKRARTKQFVGNTTEGALIVPDAPQTFIREDGSSYAEVPRALTAFKDYLQMGKSRSLERLAKRYFDEKTEGWAQCTYFTIERTLKKYSSDYNWQQRIRDRITQVSARALAKAQREAALNARTRIEFSQMLQKHGMLIILKAKIKDLTADEARRLLKPAVSMLSEGLSSERAEAGESLARISPSKPIDQMDDEELQTYIDALVEELA